MTYIIIQDFKIQQAYDKYINQNQKQLKFNHVPSIFICFHKVFIYIVQRFHIAYAFSCCGNINHLEVLKELNVENIIYVDFEMNELPQQGKTNLLSIKSEQTQIMILILRKESNFIYQINYDKNKYLSIHNVRLGVFQQIIIKLEILHININWLSDFQNIFQHKFPASNQIFQIYNNQEFICQEQIQIAAINQFIKDCEANLNINLKLHPQIQYLQSQFFNNNFYKISFWIKQLVQDNQNMLIEIKEKKQQKYITIQILWQHAELHYDGTLYIEDEWRNEGWVLFQIGYQLINGSLKYQRGDQVHETIIPQTYQFQLRLLVQPHMSIIFTEVLLKISPFSKGNLCVPGCKECDQSGYCLLCEIGYLQRGQFCECEQDFEYFFSPSECYIKLDYHVRDIHSERIIKFQCPIFGGQICPQCEYEDQQFISSYCLFTTDIQIYSQNIELDFNFYHIQIDYNEKDNFQIEDITHSDQLEYQNIIKYQKNEQDVYMLGSTNAQNIVCFKGFYFLRVCKKLIRSCQNQFIHGICIKCIQKHFIIYDKCKKCPAKCEFCILKHNKILCLKCVDKFFLNFQRKCVPCKLQYCEQCYYYNGKFNTLERSFNIQKQNSQHELGCSYCRLGSSLQLENRMCVFKDQIKIITINQQSFVDNYNLRNYLEKVNIICQEKVKQCKFCQDNLCLQCNDDYFLDASKNICLYNSQKLQIYNQNQILSDHSMYLNIVTFLYFNYSYIDIIQQQQQFYIKNCQFNDFMDKNKVLDIYCDRKISYLSNFQQQCSSYCLICLNQQTCLRYKYHIEFNLNFTIRLIDNIIELEIFKSYITNFSLIQQRQSTTNIINVTKFSLFTGDSDDIYQNFTGGLKGYDISIQNTNISIKQNYQIFFTNIVSIINSEFNIFKWLTIKIQPQKEGKFLLESVTFTGMSETSKIIFLMEGESMLLFIKNITFQNLSEIKFVTRSYETQIENFHLINLELTSNQPKAIFIIESSFTNITGLSIENCSFTNVDLFDVESIKIEVKNIKFLDSFLKYSMMIIFHQKMFAETKLDGMIIQNVICIYSILIQLQRIDYLNSIQTQIQDVLIQHSKLIHSLVFQIPEKVYQMNTIFINNILVRRNHFQSSGLIDFQCVKVAICRMELFQNIFQLSFPLIILDTLETNISKILYQNNENYGQILRICSLDQLQLKSILLKDSTFLSNRNEFHSIFTLTGRKYVNLTNIYFIDIKTPFSLIMLQCGTAYLDNLQILNLELLYNQAFILYILPEIDNLDFPLTTICYLFLFNITYYHLIQDTFQSNSIIKISIRYFSIDNLYFQNLFLENYTIFQMIQNKNYQIKYSQFFNIACVNFIFSSANSNSLSMIIMEHISTKRNLISFEPFEYNQIKIDQIKLIEIQVLYSIINFKQLQTHIQQNIILEKILIRQTHSNCFISIYSQKSIVYIKNLVLTQSKFIQFVQIQGNWNKFKLLQIKLFEIEFESKYETTFLMSGKSVIINDLLLTRVINLLFFIESTELFVNNLIIINSQLIAIKILVNQLNNKQSYPTISNMHLLNNFISQGSQYLLKIYSKNQSIIINNLHLHNNLLLEDSILLLLEDTKYNLQMFLTNNQCGEVCILVIQNSTVLIKESILFQNLAKKVIDIDASSQVRNYQIQSNINQKMTLVVDNRILINEDKQQILYLPSGQKLKEHKVYDWNDIRFEYSIKNFTLINHNNHNNSIIFGIFQIQVYEYDQHNDKVINDLSKQQSFLQFEQAKNHFELNDFQIVYNPYSKNILMIKIEKIDDSQFKLKLFAKTQLCQMGEILTKDKCLICRPELQIYSVKQKSNFCSIVDHDVIQDHLQGAIMLRQGYWRPYVYSSKIEQCDPQNDKCKGGWQIGNSLCKIGCIGAICNACDIYNIRGDGYYLIEQNQCRLCGEFKYMYLLLKLIFIMLILCLKLVLQVSSNIQNYQKLVLQRQVNHRHFHILSKYLSGLYIIYFITDIPSLIFNLLIGNLAILKLIVQRSIELPDIMTIFTNPVVLEQNSYTCIQKFINLDYNYWIYYFKLIIPILTFNVFFILMVVFGYNKIKTYFMFPIISLFLSQGPSLLIIFIQQALYTAYSNIKYTNLDLSTRFYSKVHQRHLHLIILPIIVLLMFVLPLLLMILIKNQSKRLLKDKYMQMGNFVQPFISNYQEVFNFFKNSSILLLLSIKNQKLSQSKIIIIIALIMFISLKNEIYKLKLLSKMAQQTAIQLIYVLCFTLFFQQVMVLNNVLIVSITLFILDQVKLYIQSLFKSNKLQLLELLNNNFYLIKFLGLKNYLQCHVYWRKIKLNHKLIVQKQSLYHDQRINDIILQSVQTKMTSNSLIEIEMMQL